ncbi:MAG: transposase [Saprospiraceae bacterium]|jgi:putative transposase|nr:transposase [Saprospiraceae bacterium]
MVFEAYHLYHVYNQGNNRQQIFFHRENYLLFLKKVNENLKPICEVLAWCLMPNHFHLLLGTSSLSVEKVRVGGNEMTRLSKAFKVLESSYCRAINYQEKRTGSIFRQRTKSKRLTGESFPFDDTNRSFPADFTDFHSLTCFNYIHDNPVNAGLVLKPEEWEFSSFQDYAGLRLGKLCNQELCRRWISFDVCDLAGPFPRSINPEQVKLIF